MSNLILSPIVNGVVIPLLLASSGHSHSSHNQVQQRVDLIELNHHYDDLGRHSYDQVIFYEWCPEFKRFHVISWCLVDDSDRRLPKQLSGSRDWVVRWFDRDAKVQRELRGSIFRETWSRVDPERRNKQYLGEKYRLSLLPAKRAKQTQRIALQER